MDNNKILEIEEEHNRNNRLLDEAEETLDDYRKKMQQNTENLAEHLFSICGKIKNSDSRHYIQQIEEISEEFNWDIRQKQRELEETRDEEQREFKRKLDL